MSDNPYDPYKPDARREEPETPQPYGQQPDSDPQQWSARAYGQQPDSDSDPQQQWSARADDQSSATPDDDAEWVVLNNQPGSGEVAPLNPYEQSYPSQIYSGTMPQSSPSMPPKRSGRRILLFGGLAVLLLLVGGAAFAYFTLLHPPAVAIERSLPSNTLGYLSINVASSGDQKAALEKLRATFEAQPGFQDSWAKISDSITQLGSAFGGGSLDSQPSDVSLDAVSSYLGGNLTIGILPPSTTQLEALQQGGMSSLGDVAASNVVGMVDLDFNPLNKKGPLADFKRDADSVTKLEVAEKYRDVDIRKWVTGTNELYFALLNGSSTAIIGAKAEPLRALIDEFKDNKGLGQDATYQALQAEVPKDRLVSLYINLGEIYHQAKLADPASTTMLNGIDGQMLLTVSAADEGFQIDTVTDATYDASILSASSMLSINPNAHPDTAIVADVPQDAMFFIAGTDLKTAAQAVITALPAMGASATDQYNSMRDQLKEQTGDDLEQDILPLLGGDYVLSGAAQQGSDSTLSAFAVQSSLSLFAFQLKLKTEDHDKAAKVLGDLVHAFSPQAVSTATAGGTFWNVAPPSAMLVGVGSDRLIGFANINSSGGDGQADLNALVDKRGQGLGTTDTWKGAAKHMLNNSNVIAYVNLTSVREMYEKLQSAASSDEAQPDQSWEALVRPLKYVLVSSTSTLVADNHSRNHSLIFIGVSQ